MASLSCPHLLFPVHVSAGSKAERDLTDVYVHHCDITKETVEQCNLQFEDEVDISHWAVNAFYQEPI